MPTPFTHLATAQRLINDSELPDQHRDFLISHWGDFLLGSIAPDAQGQAGLRRHDTHFFRYEYPIEPPAKIMLNRYPTLAKKSLSSTAHVAFIAGYAGHLTVDEIWWINYLYPNFAIKEWQNGWGRELVLHGLVTIMDQRDFTQLQPDVHIALESVRPTNWLQFLSDEAISEWRSLVAMQLQPGSKSLTYDVLGRRIPQGPQGLQALVENPERVEAEIWSRLSQEELHDTEERMYNAMRLTIINYLDHI